MMKSCSMRTAQRMLARVAATKNATTSVARTLHTTTSMQGALDEVYFRGEIFSSNSGVVSSDAPLDASHYGYRVVSVLDNTSPCYTTTMSTAATYDCVEDYNQDAALANDTSDYDDPDCAAAAACTHSSLGCHYLPEHEEEEENAHQLLDAMHLSAAAREVLQAHQEWDVMLKEDAAHPPHLECLKEDPYVHKYDTADTPLWQDFTKVSAPQDLEDASESSSSFAPLFFNNANATTNATTATTSMQDPALR